MLIFTNFVPISLLVTLEMVRFIQAFFISKDADMKTGDDIFPVIQSSNLNEEIGQIHYIFSDKTGTLTCNIMEFKKICIGGVSYGENHDLTEQNRPKVTNVDFADNKFFADLAGKGALSGSPEETQQERIKAALLHISLCHTIICETKAGGLEYNVMIANH
jgi:phospholipid-transporting ATPase